MTKSNVITSLDDLGIIYGPINKNSLIKETTELTVEYQRWIEASPFFALASSGSGGLDCSPRGDKRGKAFDILSNTCLAIPDRRGNNRIDTLKNIIEDPRVALMFLIPGINETLRINGVAKITVDPDYLDRFIIDGKRPATVILIQIQAVYFQCARALIRSDLWNSDQFENRNAIPTAGKMIKAAAPEFDSEMYDRKLSARQKSSLY